MSPRSQRRAEVCFGFTVRVAGGYGHDHGWIIVSAEAPASIPK